MPISLTHQMTFFSYYSFMLERMPYELKSRKAGLWIRLLIGNPITIFFICLYFSYRKGEFIFKELEISVSTQEVTIEVINNTINFSWSEFVGVEELRTLLLLKFEKGDVPIPRDKLTTNQVQDLFAHIESL